MSPSDDSPMRRVKTRSTSRDRPNRNICWFSRKSCRFSGKKSEKRVKLICCVSASSCAKSVLTVKSAVRPEVTPHFASMPISRRGLVSAATTLRVPPPSTYGRN